MSEVQQLEADVLNGLAAVLEAQEPAITAAAGAVNVTIENGIVKLEGDAEGKLSPLVKGIVAAALATLNPLLFAELPAIEGQGVAWAVAEMKAEAARLTAAPAVATTPP